MTYPFSNIIEIPLCFVVVHVLEQVVDCVAGGVVWVIKCPVSIARCSPSDRLPEAEELPRMGWYMGSS